MMTEEQLAHLKTWIGKSEELEDDIRLGHAKALAATLGVSESINNADELAPLWHWTYFLEAKRESQLGPDGHPKRGGFVPPVPLANRMWAGGRVEFLAPLRIGDHAKKKSTILNLEHKLGKSGELVFVTVEHVVSARGEVCIREEHDIVYKQPADSSVLISPTLPKTLVQDEAVLAHCEYTPSSTTLFRYSALTFNGHRIHYDQDYCRSREGYANLVIHGPLNATMMAGLAQAHLGTLGKRLKQFAYRGLRPAILGETLSVRLRPAKDSSGFALEVLLSDGSVCMQAQAS